MMKTLILDKSALMAASGPAIEELRQKFDFLLTGILLHEILSGGVEEWNQLSEDAKRALLLKNGSILNKAIYHAGDSWIRADHALVWEMERGCPSRTMPKINLGQGRRLHKMEPKDIDRILRKDGEVAKLLSDFQAPYPGELLTIFSQTGEKEAFEGIQQSLLSPKVLSIMKNDCKAGLEEFAKKKGLKLSESFWPDRTWFSFGTFLSGELCRIWKIWKYGNNPMPNRLKATNFHYDHEYLGYMAIADGVLSSDQHLVKGAWLLWPEKREHIYYYNQTTREVEGGVPQWKS